MPSVKISHINREAVLNNKDYYWLLSHLHQDLQLLSISYYRNSAKVCTFSVFTDDSCLTIFPDSDPTIAYEVNYND